MIITVAFDIKNHVEVLEGWPIKIDNSAFFLEREGNVAKKVCISYSGIDVEAGPNVDFPTDDVSMPTINVSSAGCAKLAIAQVENWQAVVSGLQIFDIDFDNYELRFRAESVAEEENIPLKSFRAHSTDGLNASCDFEQIGRAYCAGTVNDHRIESTSHYREGRIALEAERFVDAYNNFFLFLETRYCDGKTGNAKQADLLMSTPVFCESLQSIIAEEFKGNKVKSEHVLSLLDNKVGIKEKVRSIVELRGSLRHHSLKRPGRWNPNKQRQYEESARFLGAVVAHIVIAESIADIYGTEALQKFREISVATGFETKIQVHCRRLEPKQYLSLDMSYPTTVISSQICLVTFRNALAECERSGQLDDTIIVEAAHRKSGLELFVAELHIWAFTETRSFPIEEDSAIDCVFEHFSANAVRKDQFSIPIKKGDFGIAYAWTLIKFCFDRIERIDPTTRVLSMKLIQNGTNKPLLKYQVGAQVRR